MNLHLSTLLVAVALALPALPLSAQEVRFSGKVENGEGVCYYCPGYDFVIDFTHTSLSSSTIDLAPFVGGYVTGVGHWNGSISAPAIAVTSIELAPQAFSIGGNASPGGKLSFSVIGSPGDFAIIALAFNDGFFTVSSADVAFLSPQSLFVFGQGSMSGGKFDIKVDVPDNAALVGLNLFGQAAIVHGDGTLTMTNSDRKVID